MRSNQLYLPTCLLLKMPQPRNTLRSRLLVQMDAQRPVRTLPRANLPLARQQTFVMERIATQHQPSILCPAEQVHMAGQMTRGVDHVDRTVAKEIIRGREGPKRLPLCFVGWVGQFAGSFVRQSVREEVLVRSNAS